MIKRLGAVALTLLLLVMPAQASNGKGHMTVAYIAYKNLDHGPSASFISFVPFLWLADLVGPSLTHIK